MSDKHYEVKQAADGQWYWTLVGANGETLATSETYTRKADAERGAHDAADGTDVGVVVEDD